MREGGLSRGRPSTTERVRGKLRDLTGFSLTGSLAFARTSAGEEAMEAVETRRRSSLRNVMAKASTRLTRVKTSLRRRGIGRVETDRQNDRQ